MLTQKPLRRSSALRLAPVAAAVLLLAGCGSKSDPLAGAGTPALPSSAPSVGASSAPVSTPSASPTAALAPMPAAANAHTDEGAIAFTKYYFNTLLNAAFQTGNLEPLVLVSDVNCAVCRATIGDSATFAGHGLHPEGGTVSVTGLKVMNSGSTLTSILLTYSKTKLSELNVDGSTAYSTGALTDLAVEAQVQWDSTAKGWKMRQIIDDPSAPAAPATSTPSASPTS